MIDAQGDGGYETAHIPGSINFDLSTVLDQATELIPNKDHPIIVSCTDDDCLGSEFVGTVLVKAGYTHVNRFPGGVAEWSASGRLVNE